MRLIPSNPLEAMLSDLDAANPAGSRDMVLRSGTGGWGTAELELGLGPDRWQNQR